MKPCLPYFSKTGALKLPGFIVLASILTALPNVFAEQESSQDTDVENFSQPAEVGRSLWIEEFEQWRRKRYEYVVRQSTELSCGAASAAMLLNQKYGKNVTEADALQAINSSGEKKISMLEIKRIGATFGVDLIAAKVGFEYLKKNNKEAIVLLKERKSAGAQFDGNESPLRANFHYVLFVAVIDDFVLIRDPAHGNRYLNVDDFLNYWVSESGGEKIGYAIF